MRNIETISTAALLKMAQTPEVDAELDRRGEMLSGVSRRPDTQTADLFSPQINTDLHGLGKGDRP